MSMIFTTTGEPLKIPLELASAMENTHMSDSYHFIELLQTNAIHFLGPILFCLSLHVSKGPLKINPKAYPKQTETKLSSKRHACPRKSCSINPSFACIGVQV